MAAGWLFFCVAAVLYQLGGRSAAAHCASTCLAVQLACIDIEMMVALFVLGVEEAGSEQAYGTSQCVSSTTRSLPAFISSVLCRRGLCSVSAGRELHARSSDPVHSQPLASAAPLLLIVQVWLAPVHCTRGKGILLFAGKSLLLAGTGACRNRCLTSRCCSVQD